jgi:hypothetical protein
VFENRVLRRIFGSRRDEVIKERRKLYNEELYDLYSSPNIVRVIKSRRMRCSANGGEERCIQGIVGENQREGDHLEEHGVEGRILLRLIFRNCDAGYGSG